MGRFMTPDWAAKPITVPYARFGAPQTLNLYGYVRNNPLNKIDPDGHEIDLTGDAKDKATEQQRITANASKPGESGLFKSVTDRNGKTTLQVDKAKAGEWKGPHSLGYKEIVQTINSKRVATVEMWDKASQCTCNPKGNITVHLDRNVTYLDQNFPYRDAQGRVIPNPFSIIAGHELLGHARLDMIGNPYYWQDGPGSPTFQNENQLRKEQGLPPRPDKSREKPGCRGHP